VAGAEKIRIRLYGIDSPEKKQSYGQKAKAFVSKLAFGKSVSIRKERRGMGKFGRLIGEVILPDGRVLNHEIVRAGFAWWFKKYAPTNQILRDLEAEARGSKKGLWGSTNPTPPWKWRRLQKRKRAPPRAHRPKKETSSLSIDCLVIGNKRSKIFHVPGGKYFLKMKKSRNRVCFKSKGIALAEGFRPSKR
jgi:hypothetical protein